MPTREEYIAAGKRAVAAGDIDAANEIAAALEASEGGATSPTPSPQPSTLGQVGDIVTGLGSAMMRGIRGAPVAFGQKVLGLGQLDTMEQLRQAGAPVGQDTATRQMEQFTKATPEEQYREAPLHPFVAAAAESLPSVVAAGAVNPAVGAETALGRIGAAGVESGIASTMVPESDMATDVATGGATQAGLSALNKLAGRFGKYMPPLALTKAGRETIVKNKAAVTLQKWHGLSAEQAKNLYTEAAERLGPAAKTSSFYTLLTPEQGAALRNIEKQYAAASGPEGAQVLIKAQAQRNADMQRGLEELSSRLKMTPAEREQATQAYAALNSTPVAPDRLRDLVNHPAMDDILKLVKSDKHTAAKLNQYDPMSAAYWEEVKKLANEGVTYTDNKAYKTSAQEAAWKDLARRAKVAVDEATQGSPDILTARSLYKKDILNRELEDLFAKQRTVNLGDGKYGVSTEAVSNLAAGQNWGRVERSLSKLTDQKEARAIVRTMQLVREIADDYKASAGAVKQLGKSDAPYTEAGGLYSSAVRELGDLGRGGYNKAILEVMTAEEHVAALQRMAKLKKADQKAFLATLISQVHNRRQAEEASGE